MEGVGNYSLPQSNAQLPSSIPQSPPKNVDLPVFSSNSNLACDSDPPPDAIVTGLKPSSERLHQKGDSRFGNSMYAAMKTTGTALPPIWFETEPRSGTVEADQRSEGQDRILEREKKKSELQVHVVL